jgi:hypothetical protein
MESAKFCAAKHSWPRSFAEEDIAGTSEKKPALHFGSRRSLIECSAGQPRSTVWFKAALRCHTAHHATQRWRAAQWEQQGNSRRLRHLQKKSNLNQPHSAPSRRPGG